MYAFNVDFNPSNVIETQGRDGAANGHLLTLQGRFKLTKKCIAMSRRIVQPVRFARASATLTAGAGFGDEEEAKFDWNQEQVARINMLTCGNVAWP